MVVDRLWDEQPAPLALAPSILAADFAALGAAVSTVERGGADLIHVDVMDGHFVPNITIGVPVTAALHKVARVPLDVHLMIAQPDQYVAAFAAAGAAMISVHVEAAPHLHRTVSAIRALGVRAGVAINPGTAVQTLAGIAADVDFVVLMSVNPGFGGQSFLPHSPAKVAAVRRLLDEAGNRAARIEVDGGIDRATIADVVRAGATILVAGSAVFGAADPAAEVGHLRRLAERARQDAAQP